jgi:hypothetical protein
MTVCPEVRIMGKRQALFSVTDVFSFGLLTSPFFRMHLSKTLQIKISNARLWKREYFQPYGTNWTKKWLPRHMKGKITTPSDLPNSA